MEEAGDLEVLGGLSGGRMLTTTRLGNAERDISWSRGALAAHRSQDAARAPRLHRVVVRSFIQRAIDPSWAGGR